MAPSATGTTRAQEIPKAKFRSHGHKLSSGHATKLHSSAQVNGTNKNSCLLDRDLHHDFPVVVSGNGSWLTLKDGRTIFDATGGAAVSCLGYGNQRVVNAIMSHLSSGTPYLASAFFGHEVVEQLCKELINGTGGEMSKVYLTGSGSEAMEAVVKLSRQYFYENDKNTKRVNFIAREGSYHGSTIGALGMSGHVARRAIYLPFLMDNVHHISSCNPYRQREPGESDESFVARKAAELEAKFQELGPETVIGFVCEPVVGAALGCVAAVPGYLKAMKEVCHRHGALFILDEVMCGMGRTGTLHAWQAENVVPDLQTVGKGLGGGYQPIAAVFIGDRVVKALSNGTGQFIHGQTYQGMPVQAAASLEVQRIIREDNLLENVRIQGAYLEKLLNSYLRRHPNVGDIRGRGLFWGIEFVRDKETKTPFDAKLAVASRVQKLAFSDPYNMTMYPGTGSADGVAGDHVILAPAYTVTREEIERIAQVTADVIRIVFKNL
ncbi:pyridoxal phosphate-dependent transferase [Xylogone sp. PMI_703]|nr:pyridoxal phosphate-dependent transferase [Xylogone sp. PMI_703]